MKNLYQQVKNGEVSRRLVESLRLFKANEASIRLMVSPYEAVQLLLDDTITHTAWASREGTEEVIITRARLQIDGKWHNLSVAIQKGREEFTIYFDHPQRRRQRM